MSSEIQLYEKMVDPIQAIERLGSMMAKSGLSGAEKTETGMMLAWACMAERKSPFEIFRTYHLVEGKLAMRSDAMLAGFRNRGGKVKWKQFDATAAIGLFSFEGVETEIGFTMEDAKRMEVIRPRSGWTKAPDAMLRARCIAKAVRMICPEVIAGYLSVEEITDDAGDAPGREIALTGTGTAGAAIATTENSAPKRGRPAKTEAPPIDVPSTVQLTTEPTKPANESKPKQPSQPVSNAPSTTAGTTEPINPTQTTPSRFIAAPGTPKQPGGDPGIDVATVGHLMEIIGDNANKAAAWLMSKNWITNNSLATLSAERAQKIIDKTDVFIRQLK